MRISHQASGFVQKINFPLAARNMIGLLLTIYLFWAINLPNRLLFAHLTVDDLRDLLAIPVFMAIAAAVFYIFRKKNGVPFFIATTGSWIILQPLIGYTYYTLLNNIPLIESDFYRIDLPLSLALFAAWSFVLSRNESKGIAEKTPLMFQAYAVDKELRISTDELLTAFRDGNKCFLLDEDMKTYSCDLTLRALEENLCSEDFFRINRSVIIHKKMVKGFQPQMNRTILVIPENPLPSEVDLLISRARAPQFKKWWRKGSTIRH